MKVLVTGATGNVGSAVVRRLADNDAVTEVIAVARRPGGLDHPGVRHAAADLARDDLRDHLERVDALVHLAWDFLPQRRPVDTWSSNVVGSVRLFSAAIDAGVGAIVHASSVGAYSPRSDDLAVTESWPTHALPTAAYGREKSYLERVLDGIEVEHPQTRVVRLRSAFVFQESATHEQLRIFAGGPLARLLVGVQRLPVLPFPRSMRMQAVHADDLAAAYTAATIGDARGPFNIAAGGPLDASAFAAAFGARALPIPDGLARSALAAGYASRLVPTDPGLLELALSLPVMDTTRASEQLGWRPLRTGREALDALVAGLDAQAAGATPALADEGGPRPATPDAARAAASG
ncbi:MAG: NAD-dependent epimerase/dehydratase family protein [Actinomycetota bacterium]|nr:NAD-dependent epimerase/dehydratase family protein [Actinomycetota bacterium]